MKKIGKQHAHAHIKQSENPQAEHSMEMSDMHGGHGGQGHGGHAAMFKRRFFRSLFLAVPIFIFSPMMGMRFFFTFTFPGSNWIVLVLATVLFFYGGKPFIDGAISEFKEKKPAMMSLITLGISVSYLYSVYAFVVNTFFHPTMPIMDFFWELASLIVIMLFGHWMEMAAVSQASSALESLANLLPNDAQKIVNGQETQTVSLSSVIIGDHLRVAPGEKIPTDGNIIAGSTSVNESLITGEAKAVTKSVGDTVIGGSINGAGVIDIEVKGTGESGYLAQVMQLVSKAQEEKSHTELLSDKVASLLFYFATSIGVIAFIIWLALGYSFDFSLERLVTVLVIACPHALGLAIPLVIARSTSLAVQHGLLIQNRESLEKAGKIDVVVMDKTGTLTEGKFEVTNFDALKSSKSRHDILALISGLEMGSSHPLAEGIILKAQEEKVQPKKMTNIQNIEGSGLSGMYDNKNYFIVNKKYLEEHDIAFDENLYNQLAATGNSVSVLVEEDTAIGIIAAGDTIRPESKQFIEMLKARDIEPIMLTGDNKDNAQKVGRELGIDRVHAQARPDDKNKLITKLQSQGKTVMMVGDGVNDAPSLARADIGVAIGAGTDVAIDSADVILVKSNPLDIIAFLNLAHQTMKKMIENIWWGAGYNIVAIPLAAGALAYFGFILSPSIGAILMSLSTIIVAINAMTLKMKVA